MEKKKKKSHLYQDNTEVITATLQLSTLLLAHGRAQDQPAVS